MKLLRRYKLLALILLISSGCLYAQPDQVQVRLEDGSGSLKRVFDDGAVFFTNRNHILQDITKSYKGFEFLASDGKVANTGNIIPSSNGSIYIIAPSNRLIVWILAFNSEFGYSDGGSTKLSIYSKSVTQHEIVPIPNVTHFAGATPLAKSIRISYPCLSVKGNLIDILDFTHGKNVFPPYISFKIPVSHPSYLIGNKNAVSSIEYSGAPKLKSPNPAGNYAVVHYSTVNTVGWTYAGNSFSISPIRNHYVYKYNNTVLDTWIDVPLPKSAGTTAPTLIFSDSINWVDYQPLTGTVITKSIDPRNIFISNPALVI